jgi:hypothetical protein
MRIRFLILLIAPLACWGLTRAWAALTVDEVKCQTVVAGAQSGLIASAANCVAKCQAGALKGTNPVTDCVSPFAGATAACVQKPTDKAIALETSKCKSCPLCYTGGDCTADAPIRTMSTGTQSAAIATLLYCADPPSADELKCESTAAKTLGKLLASVSKCGAKCKLAEAASKVPPGSCVPGAPMPDPKTNACAMGAETKAAALIDKKCEAVNGGTKPACYMTNTGQTWVNLLVGQLPAAYNSTYCETTTTTSTTTSTT